MLIYIITFMVMGPGRACIVPKSPRPEKACPTLPPWATNKLEAHLFQALLSGKAPLPELNWQARPEDDNGSEIEPIDITVEEARWRNKSVDKSATYTKIWPKTNQNRETEYK